MYARGAIVGLTRGSGRAQIARAVLEGIAYQVKDLLGLMEYEAGSALPVLRVDGGACVSNVMMQFQADILRCPIDRPKMIETTGFGAAFLAGLSAGLYKDWSDVERLRESDRVFTPEMPEEKAAACYRGWLRAVERACKWVEVGQD